MSGLFCEQGRLIFSPPLFDGVTRLAFTGLAVLLLLCVIAALWIAPTAASLTPRERRSGAAARIIATLAWPLISLLILGALVLIYRAPTCATHAYLVSDSPAASAAWGKQSADFLLKNQHKINEKKLIVDLAPIRDAILADLAMSPHLSADTIAIELPVIVERALISGAPKKTSVAPLYALEPSLIETAELALLMAWRARHPSPEDSLSYIVTDRARAYGWDWSAIPALYFAQEGAKPTLDIERVTHGAQQATLLRIVTVKEDAKAGMLVALVLISTGGTSAKLKISLVDDTGKAVAQQDVTVPAGSGEIHLKELTFTIDPSRSRAATGLRQSGADTLPLPPRRPAQALLALEGDNSMQDAARRTIDYLLSGGVSCRADSHFVSLRSEWMTDIDFTINQRIRLASSGETPDVVLRMPARGGVWVLPAAVTARHKGGATPPTGALPDQVVILWRTKDGDPDARFNLHRLGLPAVAVRGIEPTGAQTLALSTLQGMLEEPKRLRNYPLSLDAFALEPSPFDYRFVEPDVKRPELEWRSAFLGVDLLSAGAFCDSTGIPAEPEVFFALWKEIFERIEDATDSGGSAQALTALRDGAPRVVIDRAHSDSIGYQRLIIPIILVFAAIMLYFTTMAWGVALARGK